MQRCAASLVQHFAGMEHHSAGAKAQPVAGEDAVPEGADQLRDQQRHKGGPLAQGGDALVHICSTGRVEC